MIKQQDLGYPATRLPSSQTNLCLPELGPVNFGQPLLLSVFNRQSSRFPTAPLSSPTKEWPGRLGLRLLLRCRPNTIVLVVYIHPNEKICLKKKLVIIYYLYVYQRKMVGFIHMATPDVEKQSNH